MAIVEGKVLFYEGPHYMFSNFSAFSILWRGRRWMTSEHAYQAEKFADRDIMLEIWLAPSAHDAKKLARKYDDHKRADWDEVIKLAVMEEIVRTKLYQHEYIQESLEKTGEMELVEDSPKDSFWGRGSDWKGQNHLGKIWMKLRKEIREKNRRV